MKENNQNEAIISQDTVVSIGRTIKSVLMNVVQTYYHLRH